MIKIYNSLSNKIEEFIPHSPNQVNMYVCGPTVYDNIHVGNARPVIFFDMLKSYLQYRGFQVKYASNITDVDDKIINRAQLENVLEEQIAKKYTDAFFKATAALGSKKPDIIPYATDYIEQMINYIDKLIENGYAYKSESGVYFRVLKVKDYGMLSNQTIANLKQGVRVDLETDKENPVDFALWKFTKTGITYQSPWGNGRPGWHTECAAMTHELFDGQLDIHGGGMDLKFPHHENEIAQAVAINENGVAKYWMHVGRIDFENEKMSKSIGNVIFVKDLIKKFSAIAYRYYVLSYHYRQPFDFNEEQLVQISKNYDKIILALKKAWFVLSLNKVNTTGANQEILDQFVNYMDDDFNTPNVVSLIEASLKQLNKEKDLNQISEIYQALVQILEVFGVMVTIDQVSQADLDSYRLWQEARNNQDYKTADYYRQILLEKGWI